MGCVVCMVAVVGDPGESTAAESLVPALQDWKKAYIRCWPSLWRNRPGQHSRKDCVGRAKVKKLSFVENGRK